MNFRPFALGLLLAFAASSPAEPRPNLLLIYADDLGWKDPAFQGHSFHETPRIDAMAKEGMIFGHAYAGAGNCAPSRACLHSGTYTPRHHVFAVGRTDRGPRKSQRLVPIPNKSGLSSETETLAETLRAGGYKTGIFGKWHLDGPEGATPSEQGFEVVFDPRKGGANKRLEQPDDPKGAFSITREALAFISQSAGEKKPFFAFVSHHAIHTALEARPATLERFKAKKAGGSPAHALYAACLYDLDASVGELLDGLEKLGLADDTLIVFTSDNGATNQSPQEPLRGNKGGYYEGGIRVPMLARWPGKVPGGSRFDEPAHQVDIYPTFLAAAGLPVPSGKVLDGRDLLPVLRERAKAPDRALFWHFPGYLDNPVLRGRPGDVQLGFRTRPVSVIRKGPWKLHLFHEEWLLDGGRERLPGNGAIELYDLAADPGEKQDLVATQPGKRDELLGELLAWIEKTRAPLPTEKNPAYQSASAAGKKKKAAPGPTAKP